MKKIMLITLVMVMSASLASAQMHGAVGIYADAAGGDCFLPDTAPGLGTYNIVHVGSPGATAVQFSAPQPGCMPATYLSDTAKYPVTIGGSQTGVAVGFGACVPSPNCVLAINYFLTGATPPCCEYPVLPDPNIPSGTIELVDCNDVLVTGVPGYSGRVNGNPMDCECDPTVATEETTWGNIKALYSE